MKSGAGNGGERASMRDIARRAGVSPMTVSKALRNLPKVSRRTRTRIVGIAQQLGYRPDPEVAKLMNHLRDRSKPSFQGLICAVTDRLSELNHPYIRAMIDGARERAESRGYAFSFIHFEEDDEHRRGLRRMLWARGAQGVVVLPLEKPFHLAALLPWKDLPAVAATSSLLSPDLHRVVPSHYANTLLLCRKLSERGYRRIGLVIDAGHDSRVNHAFSAAVVWHQYSGAGVLVPPLIHGSAEPAGLKAWFRKAKPDAIIARDDQHSRRFAETLGLAPGGPVAFASTYTGRGSGWSGIDELPGEVAASAVDRLASMIQHGERGLPASPTVTLVRGEWVEGISCPIVEAAPSPLLSTTAPEARRKVPARR
jgi:DNA-binding LacI/PurR family transcriptional regulator